VQLFLEACGVVAVAFRAETLASCCDSFIHFRDYTEFSIIYHEFQIIQNSTRSPFESWKLWQTMNRSIKDIGVSDRCVRSISKARNFIILVST